MGNQSIRRNRHQLNKKVYGHIDTWRNKPLQGKYPYVYLDGIYLKRNWGGEYESVVILIAMAVNKDGYREVIGASEGMKEDKASWKDFIRSLKERVWVNPPILSGGDLTWAPCRMLPWVVEWGSKGGFLWGKPHPL